MGMATGVTPMMQQYQELKEQHPGAILFFRLGDFYEMFFEDAEVAARELELVLTGRDGGRELGRIPMCGVPYHAMESYVARLIAKGYRVAVCEQVEDPRQAKGLVRREVVRIITPGTLVEPRLLDERKNNFLAAVCQDQHGFGLAHCDLSTGEFATCQLAGGEGFLTLLDELGRLEPSEVVLEPGLQSEPRLSRFLTGVLKTAVTPGAGRSFARDAAAERLAHHFAAAQLPDFDAAAAPLAAVAAGALLNYLEETQRMHLGHIFRLSLYVPDQYMVLDTATRRNLEISRRMADGSRRGSLLWVVDKTVTAMGGRLLRGWLERPLLHVAAIRARHAAVAELAAGALLRADLRELLRAVHDLERLTGRVVCGTAHARDLLALSASLERLPGLQAAAAAAAAPLLQQVRAQIDPLAELGAELKQALNPDAPVALSEGGLIADGHHPEVDRLRAAAREGKQWIAALEARERAETGIKSLKVGYNKVFGYYLEVTRANLHLVPEHYLRKQTLTGGERYITPELKEIENEVLGAEERLTALEYELFVALREKVAAAADRLQATARAVAALDALAALAEVAVQYDYAQPEIDAGNVITIRGGRHPVVERLLPEGSFVANDCCLDSEQQRLLVITGPNMGGKSTYMRQVALICLLAQAGSFVPATAAQIGVVDRIFTRVGAADDLATGQSTFMVEMTEVANILHAATPRSLIVLDEIGRGTATFDGLSIAWAVAEYIHDPERVGAKTLLATHYHELTELEEMLPGVANYAVAVREKGEDIVFLRQIVRGGADRSYGIQVARLAGLPRAVITRAQAILAGLEQAEEGRKRKRLDSMRRHKGPIQLALFESRPHPVVQELLALNIMALTPLEALTLLHRLQEQARSEK